MVRSGSEASPDPVKGPYARLHIRVGSRLFTIGTVYFTLFLAHSLWRTTLHNYAIVLGRLKSNGEPKDYIGDISTGMTLFSSAVMLMAMMGSALWKPHGPVAFLLDTTL